MCEASVCSLFFHLLSSAAFPVRDGQSDYLQGAEPNERGRIGCGNESLLPKVNTSRCCGAELCGRAFICSTDTTMESCRYFHQGGSVPACIHFFVWEQDSSKGPHPPFLPCLERPMTPPRPPRLPGFSVRSVRFSVDPPAECRQN